MEQYWYSPLCGNYTINPGYLGECSILTLCTPIISVISQSRITIVYNIFTQMCKVGRFTLHQCPRNFRRCTQTTHWPYLVNWWSLCGACAVSRLVFKQLFSTVSIILLRKSLWHLLTRIASLISTRNILRFQSTYYPWVNQVEFFGPFFLRTLKQLCNLAMFCV